MIHYTFTNCKFSKAAVIYDSMLLFAIYVFTDYVI